MMNPRLLVSWAVAVLCWAGTAAGQAPVLAPNVSEEFQVGDRILLQVEGEKDFTDAFTVQAGPVIRLPVIGDVPLSGVRRAHLEPYLRQYLGRYLKNPVVRAQTLIRLSIVGEVEKPGFYTVPADVVLGDALMAAGGMTREAKFKSLAIDRKGEALWAGESLQLAIAEGRTVDQLGLRGGDRVVVPRESRRDPESTVRIISILVGLPMAIYAVTQIFP